MNTIKITLDINETETLHDYPGASISELNSAILSLMVDGWTHVGDRAFIKAFKDPMSGLDIDVDKANEIIYMVENLPDRPAGSALSTRSAIFASKASLTEGTWKAWALARFRWSRSLPVRVHLEGPNKEHATSCRVEWMIDAS